MVTLNCSNKYWPRITAVTNLILFIFTIWSYIFIVLFDQISLCKGLIIGAILLSLFAVGGHAIITMYLFASIRKNKWPWEINQSYGITLPSLSSLKKSISTSTATPRKSDKEQILLDNHNTTIIPSGSINNAGHNESNIPYTALPTKEPGLNNNSDTTEVSSSSSTSFTIFSCFRTCCLSYRKKPVKSIGLTIIIICVALVYSLAIIGLWLRQNTVGIPVGSITLSGIIDDITITRTNEGIIRIIAQHEHDLWYGHGIAHAQTRLWQLDFQRRLGSGRLSEAVGNSGLGPDKLFRTLDVYNAAEKDYNLLDKNSNIKLALDAYAAGINDYMTSSNTQHYLPLEFRVLGIDFEPWTPVDSLVWAKIMSWDLSGNMDYELQRYLLLFQQKLSVERINELLPPFNTSRFPTVLSYEDLTTPYQQLVGTNKDYHNVIPSSVSSTDSSSSFLSPSLLAQMQELVDLANKQYSEKHQNTNSLIQDTVTYAEDIVNNKIQSLINKKKHPLSIPALYSNSFIGKFANTLLSTVQFIGDKSISLATMLLSPFMTIHQKSCAYNNDNAILSHSSVGSFRRQRRVGASNNWVISGNLTLSGKPLLCNDPHLQLLAPSLWQLTHLSCPASTCGVETIGASFAGLPGVVIGRNRHIAFGVTNTGVDVQDLYIMQDNPNNSSEYYFDGKYIPYKIRNEIIHVAGDNDFILPVRVSRYGPVVNDDSDVVDTGTPRGPPLSLRWVSIDPSVPDTTFSAFYGLQRASNWTDFRRALHNWTAPSQNVIFADIDGNIGYQMPGWIPVRNISAGHTGAFPVPGNSSIYDWSKDPVPYDNLPRTYNPPEGFIVTANNQVTPPNYFTNLTTDWDAGSNGYRAERIRSMIMKFNKSIRVEDMQTIQADTVSYFARDIMDIMNLIPTQAFHTTPGMALRNTLYQWNKDTNIGSPYPTLWAELYKNLALLGTAETGVHYWDDAVFILNALLSDNTGTSDPACIQRGFTSCFAFAASIFDTIASQYSLSVDSTNMYIDLQSLQSNVPQWGNDVHQAIITHEIFHNSPLACLADRIVPHGGDPYTVNVGSYSYDQGKGDPSLFTMDHGSSYRQIIDVDGRGNPSDLDARSLFVHPMGADGAVFSNVGGNGKGTYDNLLTYWANNNYVNMNMQNENGPMYTLNIIASS